jgi:hypothetical protein
VLLEALNRGKRDTARAKLALAPEDSIHDSPGRLSHNRTVETGRIGIQLAQRAVCLPRRRTVTDECINAPLIVAAAPEPLDFRAMQEAIVFAAACPHCECEQLHEGYTIAGLSTLLDSGDPIEAHCHFCDEFWTVSLLKRVELSEFLAAAYEAASPPTPWALEDGE